MLHLPQKYFYYLAQVVALQRSSKTSVIRAQRGIWVRFEIGNRFLPAFGMTNCSFAPQDSNLDYVFWGGGSRRP
jgi:hypothetical protein